MIQRLFLHINGSILSRIVRLITCSHKTCKSLQMLITLYNIFTNNFLLVVRFTRNRRYLQMIVRLTVNI